MRSKITIFIALLAFCIPYAGYAQSGNTIDGRIVDDHNLPVENAYVELYNSFNAMLLNTRSSSQGRFTFRGLGVGRFIIKVKPYGTNLMEDSQDVEIVNISRGGSDFEYVNFRLTTDKRFTSQKPTLKSTIFAQEIPADAKRKFDSGSDKLRTGRQAAGILDLEEAVKIFPKYFDALTALGKEYVAAGKYQDGYTTLLRALEVYRRCGDCYYSIGVAFYKLDEIPAGLKAASAALLLEPLSPEVHLLNGILLRLNGDLDKSEAALLKAESLNKTPNPEVSWQLSLLYNKMNKNKQAADRLESYLRDSPDLDKKKKEEVKGLIAKLRAAKSS